MPFFASIYGHINAQVSANIEDIRILCVFPYHIDRASRDVSADVCPVLS